MERSEDPTIPQPPLWGSVAPGGFVYLAVALDWFSRRVLAWRLSITMEAAFCIETLEDALARYGKPEIFAVHWPNLHRALAGDGRAISMDGKDAWRDNVFVGSGAASNTRRCICAPTTASAKLVLRSAGILTSTMAADPDASLDGNAPDQAYFNPCPCMAPAETPFSDAENLFREPGPLQYGWRMSVPEHADNSRGGLLFHPGGTGARRGMRPRPRFRN